MNPQFSAAMLVLKKRNKRASVTNNLIKQLNERQRWIQMPNHIFSLHFFTKYPLHKNKLAFDIAHSPKFNKRLPWGQFQYWILLELWPHSFQVLMPILSWREKKVCLRNWQPVYYLACTIQEPKSTNFFQWLIFYTFLLYSRVTKIS